MTEPAILIVAHGQPGDPEGQQQAVEGLAAKVSAMLGARDVRGATLAMPGALERAVAASVGKAGAGRGLLVYPMFMAGGWFTRVELPRRLAEVGAGIEAGAPRILPPFGADPGLAQLALALLTEAAAAQGWRLAETGVMIAGHGSGRSRAPAEAVYALAEKLIPHVARTACGFVEEAPHIFESARGFGQRAICLPFFATRADHVTQDLPRALAEAEFEGVVLPPIGLAAQVPAMIAHAIDRGH
ncbi:CbiX/SirB N-terminal domain-containing protein [Paracoccus sp. DMF-8]|uniref:sirohydrochlorin chelatase n=1 Tax=Paracoccus sp. DMF-8 TaxID=3019445 RepID=UPI0023E815FD|nr:CbiX/SirB N-terminal domain-containing protein [Paracoccus sp. DMF-8]MDF3606894.1 CbiX/SirB N-terminal domain-containing protein [Paracoccus sp. DMF-8]